MTLNKFHALTAEEGWEVCVRRLWYAWGQIPG